LVRGDPDGEEALLPLIFGEAELTPTTKPPPPPPPPPPRLEPAAAAEAQAHSQR
jgi:hypothetical protein